MNPPALIGWAVLAVTLVALADFETTSQLATAFALLIFISTALTLGPAALENLTQLMGGTPTAPAPRHN